MEFYELPFEPYAPIRRQLLNLWRSVNHARKTAGFTPLPVEVLPLRRRIVKPFNDSDDFSAATITRRELDLGARLAESLDELESLPGPE